MERVNDSPRPRSLRDKAWLACALVSVALLPAAIAYSVYEEATDRNPTEEESNDPTYQACLAETTKSEAHRLSNNSPNIGGWGHAFVPGEAEANAEDICLRAIFPKP